MLHSLNEAIVYETLETEDLSLIPNRIAHIIAKKLSLNCVALYLGDRSLQKIIGFFIDQKCFNVYVDRKNQTLQSVYDGLDLNNPLDIPKSVNGLKLGKRNVKIYDFPFYFTFYTISGSTLTIAFSCDRKKVRKTKQEFNKISFLLHSLLFSFQKIKDDLYKSESLNEKIVNQFFSESSSIKGYLNFYLKLIFDFLKLDFAEIKVNAFDEFYSSNIGNSESILGSVLEFSFGIEDQVKGDLKLGSSKLFSETIQTKLFVSISLDYLKEIILNFNKKNFNLTARPANFYILSKIYELFIEGKIGYLDRIIENAIFIAKFMKFNQAELNNLYWHVALKNIGKVAARCILKGKSRSFEEEFNYSLSNNIINCILGSHDPKFDEIITIAEEFTELVDKNDKEALLDCLEKLKISDELKIILNERIKNLENEKCFNFMQCPTYLRKSCPAFLSQNKECFEIDNNLSYFFNKICNNCLLFR